VLVRRVDAGYCDGRDLRVTLTWGDEANDLELHLVRDPGTINSETDDCTWTTCVHEVMDWGMPGLEMDNPRKDIDHLGTLGPENIYLDEAPAGTYDVLVEYWGSGAETTANVAIAVREVTIATEMIEGFKRHFVWHVGRLTFPEGRFTPINAVSDCNDGWTYPGCGLSLPAR
jgi:uncharacterized protein YfaP (DUF2135 family)